MDNHQEFRQLFNDRMSRLETKIDSVTENIANLDKEVAVIKTKLDSLKFKVAGISSSIGSIAGALIGFFFK
jgi:peptidoglycan hydrolase CwlO-like protein